MNERIEKLITEADAYAWTISEKYVPECGEVIYLWEDAFRKRFAELIVKDCENSIKLVPTHFEAQDKIIVECLKAIRETFRS